MNKLKQIQWDEKQNSYLYNGVAIKTKEAKKEYPEYALQIEMFARMERPNGVHRVDFEMKVNEKNETEYYIDEKKVGINFGDKKKNAISLHYEQGTDTPTKGYFYADGGGRILAFIKEITKTDEELSYDEMTNI